MNGWRSVFALGVGVLGAWLVAGSASAQSVPTLLSPAAGAVLDNGCTNGANPRVWNFDWTDCAGAQAYHLRVERTGAAQPEVNLNNLLLSSHTYSNLAWVGNNILTGWTWTVRAKIGGVWGAWSAARPFSVERGNRDCMPDFKVSALGMSPTNPLAAGTFTAYVTVKNAGRAPGKAGYVDVWANLPSNAPCGTHGQKCRSVGNLAPGASTNLTFVGLAAGNGAGRALRAFVDSGCTTPEQREDNNQSVKTYAASNATSGKYLVVDLSAGPAAVTYPVHYLPAVPAGGWSDAYKSTKLVLRRIPAGTFMMGSPADELGRNGDETQHQVTLSKPFYIGVFEVTQKQWERVMGNWLGYFGNADYRDTRPAECMSYATIRGLNAGAGWPANADVAAISFMGRLRARTGKAFDLPTEAQWEYAGRAGTITALNSGKNLTSWISCPNMDEVGRYRYNGGSADNQNVDPSGGTAKVGSYLPNRWGLYDIHGNVWEWCLDWYGTYPGTVTDPKGATSGRLRVLRGGCLGQDASVCRVARRRGGWPSSGGYFILGFRTALPPDPSDP
jgi:formylglycine-generating enzyme required for sulfatase activity